MDATLVYQPAQFSLRDGRMLCDAQVIVSFGQDTWIFPREGWFHRDARFLYKWATRFLRLIERGYAPIQAFIFSDSPSKYDWEQMEHCAHDGLSDERVDVTLVDCPDMMFTDPLTPADKERLYAMWLLDGDEIFHFDAELSVLWDIPALLTEFRALAQNDDDPNGDWSHSHHLDLVAY